MSDNDASIKAVLTGWAKTLPHHPYKDFGDKVTVVSAVEKPAYVIHLHTLYDVRSPTLEFTRPYQGERITPPATSERESNVFNQAVELKADFTAQEMECIIPTSLKAGPCLRCVGKGNGSCDRCSGFKVMSCPDCQGKGKNACTACQGKGKTQCHACRGSGKVVNSISSSGARLESPCVDCGGTGGPACGRCQGGKIDCTGCQAKGKVSCSKCKGQGTAPCEECHGAGQMLKGRSFKVNYHPLFERQVIRDPEMPSGLLPQDLSGSDIGERIYEMEEPAIATPKDLPAQGAFETAVFDLLKRAGNASQNMASPAQIIRQKLFADRIPVFQVTYKFLSKEYSCWLTTFENKVISQDDPFRDLAQVWVHEARECLLDTKYAEAEELLKKASTFAAKSPALTEMKRRLELSQKHEFEALCRNLGFGLSVVVAMISGLFLSPSHHLFWPVLGLAAAVWGIGILCGAGVSRKFKGKIYGARRTRWIGAVGSALVAGLLCVPAFAILDPVGKADSEEYNGLLSRWFESSSPADLKPQDRTFLGLLVETYGPMGVDVRSAKSILDQYVARETTARPKPVMSVRRPVPPKAPSPTFKRKYPQTLSKTKKAVPSKAYPKTTKKKRR